MTTRFLRVPASALIALALLAASLDTSRAGIAQQPSVAAVTAPPVSGLVPDHATISVQNLDKEADWYVKVLGFKVWRKLAADHGMFNEQLTMPGFRIDLMQYPGSRRPPKVDPNFRQQGYVHVVFHLNDDNVARALAQLHALGLNPWTQSDDKGYPIQIKLYDPEGNEVEIVKTLPGQPQ